MQVKEVCTDFSGQSLMMGGIFLTQNYYFLTRHQTFKYYTFIFNI